MNEYTHHRCYRCHRFGPCAPDCSLAPWNFDTSYPATPFLYLLRQRRWCGRPVDRQDTRFVSERLQNERERHAVDCE